MAAANGHDDDGNWLFAEPGGLHFCDGDSRVVCHACGAGLAHPSAQHLRAHGLTPASYRARNGLNRKQSLMAPAAREQRRLEGLRRLQSPAVRDGLAVGQQSARSGELVRLGQAAQRGQDARLQRRSAATARLRAARNRQSSQAAQTREDRARDLGFAGVGEYVRARVVAG